VAALTLIMGYSAGGSALQQKSAPSVADSPLTITLATTAGVVKVDAPIPVVVTLTNVSKTPVRLRVLGLPEGVYRGLGWKFSLTKEGEKVPKTPFHRAISGEYLPGDPLLDPDPDLINHVLRPGMSDSATIDVRKLFNITQPGLNVFSIEMPPNMDSKAAIQSERLPLNVAPDLELGNWR
jgi:hypothetical protein